MKVMIVEDDPDIAGYLSITMEHAEIDCTIETSAIALMSVDVWAGYTHCITDLMLPDVSGLMLLEWMLDNVPHVRRFVFTAASHLGAEIPAGLAHVLFKGNDYADEIVGALRDTT